MKFSMWSKLQPVKMKGFFGCGAVNDVGTEVKNEWDEVSIY